MFGGKKKAEAEEPEPDEFAQLEKLEQEYQEEMRLKVGRLMRKNSYEDLHLCISCIS